MLCSSPTLSHLRRISVLGSIVLVRVIYFRFLCFLFKNMLQSIIGLNISSYESFSNESCWCIQRSLGNSPKKIPLSTIKRLKFSFVSNRVASKRFLYLGQSRLEFFFVLGEVAFNKIFYLKQNRLKFSFISDGVALKFSFF